MPKPIPKQTQLNCFLSLRLNQAYYIHTKIHVYKYKNVLWMITLLNNYTFEWLQFWTITISKDYIFELHFW